MPKKNVREIEINCQKYSFVVFLCFMVVLGLRGISFAQTPPGGVAIKEKQIIENNKNLKNAIEENQRLATKFDELENELSKLRDENDQSSVRYDELKRERDALAKTIENVKVSNRKYAQEIKGLEQELDSMQSSQQELLAKVEDSQRSGSAVSSEPTEVNSGANTEEVLAREQKTIDLLSRIDAFTEQDEGLRTDAAKAHYNMGNIYYNKGEYEIAAREYYQAVTLMPNDPDAHYNLALVSGEYLNDQKTALEHYKTYLYLKPDAADRDAIQEKIIHAQLILDSKIESPLDTTK